MRFYSAMVLLVALFAGGGLFGQTDGLLMQRILQRYTEAYGGTLDADALSSVSIEGTQTQGGTSYHFRLLKKRPGSIHYRLSRAGGSVVCAYDGVDGWMRIDDDGKTTIRRLSAEELQVLQEDGRFDSPLFRHEQERYGAVEMIGRRRVAGRETYIFEVRSPSGTVMHYYLDPVTLHLVQRDRLNEDGAVGMQTFYRDYRDVAGYPFAFEIENRVAGEVVSLVQVDSIKVNPGLLSFYFKMPAD